MKHDQSYVEKDFTVIGTRVPRPDGVDKVTGRAKYGADAYAPGQLFGLVLRSPHAHARIKSINTSKAEKVPGVLARPYCDEIQMPVSSSVAARVFLTQSPRILIG